MTTEQNEAEQQFIPTTRIAIDPSNPHVTAGIEMLVAEAKAYPYGEAYKTKSGHTLYRKTTAKLPQVRWEELGEPQPKHGRQTLDDLRGYRFGDLIVIEFAGCSIRQCNGQRRPLWHCWCLLENVETTVEAKNLKHGSTTASPAAGKKKRVAHKQGVAYDDVVMDGRADHPLYPAWNSIKARCYNPNDSDFHNYGGRGIRVCDRWLLEPNGFWNFVADMGPKPSPDHEIDRIDVNGCYHPGNCRWLRRSLQKFNLRTSLPHFEIRQLFEDIERSGVKVSNGELAQMFGCSDVQVGKLRNPKTKSHGIPGSTYRNFIAFTDDGLNLFPTPCRPDLVDEFEALPKARPENLGADFETDAREALECEGYTGKALERELRKRLKAHRSE